MELLDTLVVAEPIIQAFERLGIAYYIGGSVTSSIHGIPRSTVDIDLIADVQRASPEDIILSKLDWFRMGGGMSERQWTDVMGVLKVQHGHLDLASLHHWARELGLTDLFGQVCRDAGIEEEER